ncbi:MAG: ECF transporter S component [Methanobacterium sp.]
MLQKTMARFSTFDLVLIAVLAALGIATKPIIVPLAHLITGPLFIPGGSLAGGLYMFWLVVGLGLTRKYGTATLIGFVQALMVIGTGIIGSHGAMSLLSYTLPGVAVDTGLFLIGRHKAGCLYCCFIGGMLANLTGTLSVNVIFFRLPWLPLLLSIVTAAFSGALGGILAWQVLKALRKYKIGARFADSNQPERKQEDCSNGEVST